MPPDRSIIAVTQRVTMSEHGEQRDCLDQRWTLWVESLGFRCVPVPNKSLSAAEFVEALDPAGIILSGGNNIAADVYEPPGTARAPDAYDCRDSTERALVNLALKNQIPLLGCCRGMQFLHVYFGGRLAPVENRLMHVSQEHAIDLVAGRFRDLAGQTSLRVNSFHNFGISGSGVPEPLIPFAMSPDDGSVEGCVHRALPVAGIMWHPERPNPAARFDRRLAGDLFGAGR